jgi:hypothetical protein
MRFEVLTAVAVNSTDTMYSGKCALMFQGNLLAFVILVQCLRQQVTSLQSIPFYKPVIFRTAEELSGR